MAVFFRGMKQVEQLASALRVDGAALARMLAISAAAVERAAMMGSRGAYHLQKFSVRNNQTARYQIRQLLVDHGFELWTAPLEAKRPAYGDKNVFAAHGPILGKNLQDGGLRFRGGQICSVLDAER